MLSPLSLPIYICPNITYWVLLGGLITLTCASDSSDTLTAGIAGPGTLSELAALIFGVFAALSYTSGSRDDALAAPITGLSSSWPPSWCSEVLLLCCVAQGTGVATFSVGDVPVLRCKAYSM